jgi:lipopolysaccharide export system protein LptC
MIRASGWVPLAVLGIVTGLTWWLALLVHSLPDTTDKPEVPSADGIIDDFVARALDPQGQVRYVLTARQMTHYPKTESSALVAVKLESLSPNEPRLVVTADTGVVQANADVVTLERNVRVVRDPAPGVEPLVAVTDRLVAYPDTGKLTTRSIVIAETPSMRARSEGIDYDHKTRRYQLYRVNATYNPPTK